MGAGRPPVTAAPASMGGMTETTKTAVLLHAFPLSPEMWQPQRAALEAQGWRVLVPALPGFGGTGDKMTSLEAQAGALIEAVLPTEPVALMGLSMGGYLALEVLAALQERGEPERVSYLVLADTHACGDDAETRETREKQAQQVLAEGQGFMVENAREEQKPSTAEQTVPMIRAASREGIAAALRAMAARADRRAVLRRAGEEGLRVLAIVGADDSLTPPDLARENAELGGGQLAVIEEAGHLANLDNPEAFNAALLEFLAE